MFQDERVEAKLSLEDRDDLNLGYQTINVSVRYLPGSFAPMNGEIVNFNPETERYNIEPAELNLASGCVLEGSDDALTNHLLKGSGAHVEDQSDYDQGEAGERGQENSRKNPAWLGFWRVQKPPPPPVPAEEAKEVSTLLSDRRLFNQSTKRSFIFC